MKHLSSHQSVIFILFFTFISYHLHSQCDSLNQPTPGMDCISTNYVCDFNGLCITLEPGSWGGETQFCAGNSLQNPHWFSFVSNGEPIDFSVSVDSCVGIGIQWALYDNCNSLGNAVVCNGSATSDGGTADILYNNPVAGNTYNFVVDGFAGATCSLVFSGNGGLSQLPVEGSNGLINGDTIVCSGSTQNYSHPGFYYATSYIWSIDGIVIHTSNLPDVQLDIPADILSDTFELCLLAINRCDTTGQTVCREIIIGEDQPLHELFYNCPGDSVLYEGQYYQQGIYLLPYEGPSACYSGIELEIIDFPESEDTTFTIVVCEETDDFLYNGTNYELDSIYNNVVFEHEGRCDYKANMVVHKIDGSGLHITSNKDSLPCLGAQAALLKLEGSILSLNELISQTYIWTKAFGSPLGNNKILNVNKPGEYFLTVTSIFRNPEDLKDMDDTIICTHTLSYVIHNSQVPYEEPDIILSGSDIESGIYTLEITNIGLIDPQYLWAIPAGIQVTMMQDGKITLFLPDEGVYNFCVYVHVKCDVLDSFCFVITVDETVKNNTLKPHYFRIKENPVESALQFSSLINDPVRSLIEIYSINGIRIDCDVSYEPSDISVDVSHLHPGIYIYTITNDDGLRTVGKFVKI